mmetsp:Transcript_17564/g.52864  ORF Transcript_17564/g.52864 Transcript_17564/m.52864 type:complete len:918 (-) Transcript_17564:262-3015(-)
MASSSDRLASCLASPLGRPDFVGVRTSGTASPPEPDKTAMEADVSGVPGGAELTKVSSSLRKQTRFWLESEKGRRTGSPSGHGAAFNRGARSPPPFAAAMSDSDQSPVDSRGPRGRVLEVLAGPCIYVLAVFGGHVLAALAVVVVAVLLRGGPWVPWLYTAGFMEIDLDMDGQYSTEECVTAVTSRLAVFVVICAVLVPVGVMGMQAYIFLDKAFEAWRHFKRLQRLLSQTPFGSSVGRPIHVDEDLLNYLHVHYDAVGGAAGARQRVPPPSPVADAVMMREGGARDSEENDDRLERVVRRKRRAASTGDLRPIFGRRSLLEILSLPTQEVTPLPPHREHRSTTEFESILSESAETANLANRCEVRRRTLSSASKDSLPSLSETEVNQGPEDGDGGGCIFDTAATYNSVSSVFLEPDLNEESCMVKTFSCQRQLSGSSEDGGGGERRPSRPWPTLPVMQRQDTPSECQMWKPLSLSTAVSSIGGTSSSIPCRDPRDTSAKLRELARGLSKWDFDMFEVADATPRPLAFIGFVCLDAFTKLVEINKPKLVDFLQVIEDTYRKVPYHNSLHGASVARGVYSFCAGCGLAFSQEHMEFTLVLAGLVHDVHHPGLTPSFLLRANTGLAWNSPIRPPLKKSDAYLASKYNDQSPLENMHCAITFELLRDHRTAFLSQDDVALMKKPLVRAILGTDMAKHAETMTRLVALVDNLNYKGANGGIPWYWPAKPPVSADEEKRRAWEFNLQEEFVMELFLHAADIGNPTLPFEQWVRWNGLVQDEFHAQGDLERAEFGALISPPAGFDRTASLRAEQLFTKGFMQHLALPFFELLDELTNVSPSGGSGAVSVAEGVNISCCVENLRSNIRRWEENVPAEDAARAPLLPEDQCPEEDDDDRPILMTRQGSLTRRPSRSPVAREVSPL